MPEYRKFLTIMMFCFWSIQCFGQGRQLFDIVSLIPPAGWQAEVKPDAATWVTSNAKSGAWCRIIIYKSMASSGNPSADFSSEWQNLVAKPYPVTGEPVPDQTSGGGWTLNYGTAGFVFNQQNSVAGLYTFTGYGLKVSIIYLANTDKYANTFNTFWESIDLQEPVTTAQRPVQQQATQPAQPDKQVQVNNPPPNGSGNRTIGFATTNFDDGWTSTITDRFVRTTKGQTTVLLYHGIVLDDQLRSGDIFQNLFNRLIPESYTVTNFRKINLQEGCMFLCDYYLAADVVEKAGSKRSHLAFSAVTTGGVSRCIAVLSPSVEAFRAEFPDPGRMPVMLYYNRFAITYTDITGNWKGGSNAAMDMYYTGTGTYAGMNMATLSDEFTFRSDGSYTSRHAGAVGMIGNMNFHDASYTGKATAGNWDLSLTKRFEGRTDEFNAWFEAVQGGYVLHLQNKSASGIKYDLIRVP